MAKDSEKAVTFKDIPGMDEHGVNTSSGFEVGKTNSQEAIGKLTHINGIPIAELEKRMRPISITGTHMGMYSYHGFLGETESFLGALQKANQIVLDLGYAHDDLASWLGLALPAENTGSNDFLHNGMHFVTKYAGTVSRGQWSPFKNDQVLDDPEGDDWDGEFAVTNIDTGRTIDFAPPLPRWIKKYGFYEGFETPYNVDPQKLIDVFTRTDMAYQTREETEKELRNHYVEQGWNYVKIGRPKEVLSGKEQVVRHVSRYRDDLDGDEKIIQILDDGTFSIASLGIIDMTRHADYRIAIVDKRQGDKPVATGGAYSRARIDRQVTEDNVIVTIHHDADHGNEHDSEIIVRQEPGENGWIFEQHGSFMQVGDWDIVKDYGPFTGGSEDQFQIFRSRDVEFITQDTEGSGNIACLYKYNNKTGSRERMPITRTFIEESLGIKLEEQDRCISQIKDIVVNKDGIVEGVLVIGLREIKFKL